MAIAEAAPDVSEGEVEESILAALDEVDAPSTDEGPWRITDRGQAEWGIRKLSRARSDISEVRAIAQRRIDAISAVVAPHIAEIVTWRDDEVERLSGEEEYWESLLLLFHRRLIEEEMAEGTDYEHVDCKTIPLLNGTLEARKQPDIWNITDDELVAWAEEVKAEGVVRIKKEVDRASIRSKNGPLSVATTGAVVWGGELVPGVSVTPGEVEFSVKTGEVGK